MKYRLSLRQVKAELGLTEYGVNQLMLDGMLEKPLPRRNEWCNRYWSRSSVEKCKQLLDRTTTVTLSARNLRSIDNGREWPSEIS